MLRACFTAGDSAGASLNSGLSGPGYNVESIEHGESACEVLSRANFAVRPSHPPYQCHGADPYIPVHALPSMCFLLSMSPSPRGGDRRGLMCFAEAVHCPEAVHDLVLVIFAEAGHGGGAQGFSLSGSHTGACGVGRCEGSAPHL